MRMPIIGRKTTDEMDSPSQFKAFEDGNELIFYLTKESISPSDYVSTV